MSPAKLSEADKNEILQLYRETEETTSTLSSRFGVSNSTIGRILKNELSNGEYENLIQQKRLGRTADRGKGENTKAQQLIISLDPPSLEPSLEIIEDPEEVAEETVNPRETVTRRRRTRKNQEVTEQEVVETVETIKTIDRSEIEESEEESIEPPAKIISNRPILKRERLETVAEGESESIDEVDDMSIANIGEMFGEDMMGDDFDDEDDEEDGDFEDDDEELETLAYNIGGSKVENLQVLPFDRASVPRTCYLVVDRMAELITRPLREFGDLGAIPNEDIQAKTLPIFDNHRVARRFSHRTQRVIKVPDAPRLLEKTSSHLQAKGITRLLLDGQVYKI
jgi:transposase-like protein